MNVSIINGGLVGHDALDKVKISGARGKRRGTENPPRIAKGVCSGAVPVQCADEKKPKKATQSTIPPGEDPNKSGAKRPAPNGHLQTDDGAMCRSNCLPFRLLRSSNYCTDVLYAHSVTVGCTSQMGTDSASN